MIETKQIFDFFKKNNIDFFSGVPDSILKKTSHYLEKKNVQNIVAANEGAAVSIGLGYYLKTKKIPVIYMQNSGLGNAINPLISLANSKVYRIPVFMIVGWRGEKSKKLDRFLSKKNLDFIEELAKIGANFNISSAQLSISWLLRRNSVSSIILGNRNITQLEESLNVFEINQTDREQMEICSQNQYLHQIA